VPSNRAAALINCFPNLGYEGRLVERVHEMDGTHSAGEADIKQPTGFVDCFFRLVVGARNRALLQVDHDNGLELQPLRAVQSHQIDLVGTSALMPQCLDRVSGAKHR